MQLNRTYSAETSPHIVRLFDSFDFQNHLCIVFELLSMNVYELITENNVREELAVLDGCIACQESVADS